MNKKERIEMVESGKSYLLGKENLIKAIKEVRAAYVSEVLEAYSALIITPTQTIKNCLDVQKVLEKYRCNSVESFFVLTLNGAHSIIRTIEITKGLVNKALASPREVFLEAIKDNSAAIIIAHNHPSGILIPSEEDKKVTKRMVLSGNLLDIPVLDHIIFGKTGYFSFMEQDLMENL